MSCASLGKEARRVGIRPMDRLEQRPGDLAHLRTGSQQRSPGNCLCPTKYPLYKFVESGPFFWSLGDKSVKLTLLKFF